MKEFTFWCILTLLNTNGCTDVVLSNDPIFVRENSTLTFTCSTMKNGKVKFIEIFKNKSPLARMGFINTDCTIATLVSPISNCSCVNLNSYKCTTEALTRLNNNDMWYCIASVEGEIGTKSNIVYIDVRVPIALVSIRPDMDKPMTVNEDDELHLTCEAHNGIPAANITWFMNNKTNDFNGSFLILSSSIINVTGNKDETKNTYSSLTYMVRRRDHDIRIYCNASNEDNHDISSKAIRLNVRYFPEKRVYINGHESKDAFYMIRNSITNQTLQCVVYDGNPLANLSWSCYNGTQTDMYTQSSAVSNVSWFAGYWNDSTCTCKASHVLGWTQMQPVAVNVLFEPSFLMCTIGNAIIHRGILNVTIFSNVTIHCSCEGNPKPNNFTWILPSSMTSTGQLLLFRDIQISLQGSYTLLVGNIMKPSIGTKVKGYANTTFDVYVQYPPKIRNLMKKVEVVEGVNLNLTCDAEPGNPNDIFFSWSSTEQPGSNISDQNLIIQNISRANEGEFTCFVQNMMHPTGRQAYTGSDLESVFVDVQYKASIKRFTALDYTVFHGDNLSFVCDVDSDPPASITILSPTGSTLVSIEGTNQLYYKKISSCLEDIGQFACVSQNKHNHMQPERRKVTVNVQCSPRYPAEYNQITTIKTRPGEKAVLYFNVFSNPPPTHFTWTNISNSTSVYTASTDRVIINSTYMSSVLIISSVEPWDAGIYSVRVDNEVGNKTESFIIVVDCKTSTSPNSDNGTGKVVGGTVSAVCIVLIAAALVAVFFFRKRQSRYGNEQMMDRNTLKDDTRYEDLTIGNRRTLTEYSNLDFQYGTENNRMKSPFKDVDVYENLKLT